MIQPATPIVPGSETSRCSAATSATWFIARLLIDGIDGLCVVSDLTAVGAKLMSVIPLAVDARFELDLTQGRRAAGTVRWIDPTRCGVEFDPPLDPGTLAAAAHGLASAPWFRRCVPVRLERHGREASAQLVEISPTGARLKLPREPWIREGAEIEIAIEGFYPAEAEVRRIENDQITVEFRAPMQLWRLDNQLKEWARECAACPVTDCHTAPRDEPR